MATTRRRKRHVKPHRHAVVRMYNVGFGDSFLVLFPGRGRQRRMLIDCGSIASGGYPMREVVERLISDVTDPDGVPRIDVVVASHRHRDHVSGFAQEAWADVEVREVWMPWTEDPRDAEARRIRNRQSRLAVHLATALAPMAAHDDPESDWSNPHYQMALNALSNEAAMATLHSGFAGEPKRRFLPAEDGRDRLFRTEALPGVTIHILGPTRDEDSLRDMDPPAAHSYLSLVDDADPGVVKVPEPFADAWWADDEQGRLTKAERGRLEVLGSGVGSAAIVALEKAVNGTSLFIVLQVGKAHLVFPGDAQWGTWKAALDAPDGWALLKKTTFYKIGHHGSHNANPVDYVEELGGDFWAMASVHPVDQWPDIPRKPLLEELRRRSKKVARSDKPKLVPRGFKVIDKGMVLEARIPV